MNTPHRTALHTLSAALLLVGATPASAQLMVTANGPYMAMPAWSQKLTRNRFVVLADWDQEAVLDRETGLVWQRSPAQDHFNQDNAAIHCARSLNGGRYGWRLPALPEMSTLLVPGLSSFSWTLPAGHPFDVDLSVVLSRFWTTDGSRSSPFPGIAVLIESGGEVGGAVFVPVSNPYRAWCVRGASAGSVY
jgi:hypothetical protein